MAVYQQNDSQAVTIIVVLNVSKRRLKRLGNCYLNYVSLPQVALVVKNPSANAGRDVGKIPGLGRSPGGGNGNSFQYSCLEKSMGRGA